MIPDHTGAAGEEGTDPHCYYGLTSGYMRAATDTKQPVVTHGFLGTDRSSHPLRPPAVPLPLPRQLLGKRSQVNGRMCSPVPGSGLLRSVSQRLCQQSVPGRAQEEPPGGEERQREGERDEGVGALSHRDPLEEEPHGSAAPRACVRARGRAAAPARRSEGAQKKTERGGGGGEGGGRGRRGRRKGKERRRKRKEREVVRGRRGRGEREGRW